MASNSKSVEKLLIQIRADLKDLKNLQAELKNVRKEGTDAAASIGEGFKNALGSIAAGFTTLRIKGIFDNAVADANRLEKTMLGLQATAKLTGNSFSQIKNAVTNLSKDGVLSIDQASQSMKVLLAQGVAADKAFQLVDAAKKVGAFNNIVGDTGQAVQDFIKFLQTGSAELAENLDPSLVKVVKSLGGYEAVANNAAAKQKLINAVIEKGAALTGDYEKFLQSGSQAQVTYGKAQERLSQNFGEKLAPAYSKMYALGAQLLGGIADIIKGFSSFSVSVVAFSALGVAAFASLGGAAVTFGFVTKAAFLSILGPVGAIVGALAALVAVAYELTYVKSTKEIADDYRKQKEEVNGLASSIENLSKIRNRTVSQERELRDSLEQLREKLKAAGIDYDTLAAKTKNYADFAKAATSELRTKKAADIAEQVKSTEDNLKIYEEAVRISEQYYARQGLSISQNVPLVNAEGVYRGIGTYGNARDAIEKLRARRDSQVLDQAAVLTEEDNKAQKQAAAQAGGVAKPEYRYIDTKEELLKNMADAEATLQKLSAQNQSLAAVETQITSKIEEYESRNRIVPLALRQQLERIQEERKDIQDSISEAGTRLVLDEQNLKSKLLEGLSTYLEEKGQAEREQIDQAHNEQMANLYRLYDAKQIKEKQFKENSDKIEKQYIKAQGELRAKQFTESLKSADSLARGLTKAKSGDLSGASDILSSLGGAGESFKKGGLGEKLFGESGFLGSLGSTLSAAAPIAGAAIGLVQGFSGLFQKSDAERAADAQKQADRDASALAVLQAQEKHQKDLLEFQKSQALLPFKNLQRELRITDLQAQQETIKATQSGGDLSAIEKARLQKRSDLIGATLKEQSTQFQGGDFFNNTAATPQDLSQALGEVDRYTPSFTLLNSIIQEFAASRGKLFETVGWYDERINAVQNLALPPKIKQAALDFINSTIYENYRAEALRGDSGGQIAGVLDGKIRSSFQLQLYNAGVNYAARVSGASVSGQNTAGSGLQLSTTNVDRLLGEFSADAAVIENLFGLFEQSQQTDLEIAQNTKATADNTAKLTQIDDRKFSYLDLGQKRVISKGFNVSVDRLKLPDAVSSTVLSASSTSAPSDTLSAFRRMIDLAEEANDYLAMIAANTDSKLSTNTSDFESLLIAKIADIRTRRIGKAA